MDLTLSLRWSREKPTTTTAEVPLTTSTVYTTKVYTVTKCPDSVPNCPNRGSVTTEVVALYTTVCPVTEAQTTPAGPKTTGPAVVVGAECPGGVKCPIKGEETTHTEITSYSTIYTTVSKPQSTSAPAGHGNSTAQASSSAAPTKAGSSSSSAPVKPSATQVVTAGAGRVAAALTLPAALAALFLAL
ncbi:hypothetical protein GQ53DRAFT_831342 [Thozetella sp. PMI_491]|nr:hypothetical protein GQ53DRAFT_831342 [Thozetella sp. PMI_491]